MKTFLIGRRWRAARSALGAAVAAAFALLPGARAAGGADDFSSLGMKASVTIIFDTSGSMNEHNKLVMAKQAFNWWLQSAPRASIVSWSLWTFDPRSHDARRLIDRQPDAADRVQALINQFRADGGTPLGRTVEKVTRIVEAETRRAEEGKADVVRQIVLIFTDGEDSYLSNGDMKKAITRLRNAGAEVFSIGYQGEGNYLADVSDRFVMVGDEKQLKAGLTEFSYFIEKAAPTK